MLTSLEITNFRLLEHFQVSHLGRVNLIVGKNNSGKSSVLEALRIYAGQAQRNVLQQIASTHDEPSLTAEPPGNEADSLLPFEAFFSGRQFSSTRENTITIGQISPDPDVLSITFGYISDEEVEFRTEEGELKQIHSTRFATQPEWSDDSGVPCLRVSQHGQPLSHLRLIRPNRPTIGMRPREARTPCSFIPTQFVSIDELADQWDRIALTDDQDIIKEALQIITPEFDGLTFVRDVSSRERQRTAKVKLSNLSRPVPLNSLGDGVVRILQLVLKLFPAKGGFFLIDEFENGLHFSVQEPVWTLLFRMARKLNIQIFATTHSWDCIESFARAARADKSADGFLLHVGQSVRNSDRGKTIATVFNEEQLFSITQTDVEVR
jgi:AAA15 family ATPase/GTPase